MLLKRAILIGEVALLALIAYLAVRSAIIFFTPQSEWAPLPQTAPPSTAASAGSIFINLDYDPFHRESAAAAEIVDAGLDAPETTLNLKLFGYRTGSPATAVLETPDRMQATYKVGDEIISGVTLKSVHPGYIVISRNGQAERLTVSDRDGTGLTRTPPPMQIDAPTAPETSPAPQSSASGIADALPDSYQNLVREFQSGASLRRISEDGRIQGYQVNTRSASFDLSRYGLQDGDIVTHIGSQDIRRGVPDFGALLGGLQNGSGEIRVIRQGREMTVKVDL